MISKPFSTVNKDYTFIMNASTTIANSMLRRLNNLNRQRFCRNLTSQSNVVFDKKLRVLHLDNSSKSSDVHVYDYLRDHVAKELCDRIEDLRIDGKKLVFNIGSCSSLVTKGLNPERVKALIQADYSIGSLKRSRRLDNMLPPSFPIQYLHCDEEMLPLRENSVDLVTSCLNLHWVNDLVGSFQQVHRSLKRNSAFIGAMFGGDTLFELRSSLQLAELERLSGFSPHIAPKTTGQDVATILQRCRYQLITVDISEIKINYPSMFELMFDLQGMGENNASLSGSKHMHRDVLEAAAAIYQQLYGSDDVDEGIPATFQVIHFIGWKEPTKATPLKTE